jgi:hypothetical protein
MALVYVEWELHDGHVRFTTTLNAQVPTFKLILNLQSALPVAQVRSGGPGPGACNLNSKSQFKWPHTTLLRYLGKVPQY